MEKFDVPVFDVNIFPHLLNMISFYDQFESKYCFSFPFQDDVSYLLTQRPEVGLERSNEIRSNRKGEKMIKIENSQTRVDQI